MSWWPWMPFSMTINLQRFLILRRPRSGRLEGWQQHDWFPPFETRPAGAPQGEVGTLTQMAPIERQHALVVLLACRFVQVAAVGEGVAVMGAHLRLRKRRERRGG